jgi:drug/metabolite transporter (DMT)-like permease
LKFDRSIPAAAYWLTAALALFWGLSWPLMKLGLTEMAPMRFRSFTVGFGALGLFVIAAASGANLRITRRVFWRIAGVALFSTTAWSICMAYGLRIMESGRAVIIAYTFPVWSVPVSAWLLKEPLTARRWLSLVLGMGGLLLLLGDEIYAVGRAPLGALLMLVTAMCWAVGTILAKKWSTGMAASVFTAWVTMIGVVPLIVLSLIFESGPFHPFGGTLGPMLATIYALLFASLICQWAWFKLVSITTATVASLAILSVPIVGVFFSTIVLGEVPRPTDYLALALVVGSLATLVLPGRAARTAPAPE